MWFFASYFNIAKIKYLSINFCTKPTFWQTSQENGLWTILGEISQLM